MPADNKWFTRLVVVEAIVDALEGLNLKAKEMPAPDRIRIAEARQKLEAEK